MSEANKKQHGGGHYNKPVQVWDYVHRNSIGYLAGNVIKYVSRYKDKNGLEDLKKAKHYIEKLIEEWEADEEAQFQAEIAESRRREAE